MYNYFIQIKSFQRENFLRIFRRLYHSENVFGFKSKTKRNIFKLPQEVISSRCDQSNFFRLVSAYRIHGHKCSDINPISLTKNISLLPELELNRYGFTESSQVVYKNILNVPGKERGSVKEAIEYLKQCYCKSIAAEYSYLENEEEIEWFAENVEKLPTKVLDKEKKIDLAKELLKSQTFDNFLAKRFSTLKRYGGEGAESLMAFFYEIFLLSAHDNIDQLVLAYPHRGRLNLLTGMLNFPPVKMFHKLKGNPDFPANSYQCTGDVLSHCISSTDLEFNGKSLHVTLLYNPSHLEAVNPVSMGKTRAKQLVHKDGDYNDEGTESRWSDKILNIQVHGDAAIMGQGINQECLALSRAPHFEIGGSIHLVVNNQVGFTTPAERGRSSRYCTDLAKMVNAPVIHVNADYPEDVVKVTELAFEYQRQFRKDIFIDLNCFRRWGHNELDDPTFTNPSLYSIIHSRESVPDLYVNNLIKENVLSEADCKKIQDQHWTWLDSELKMAEQYQPDDVYFKQQWENYKQAEESVSTWDTGIDMDLMTFIGTKSVSYPGKFKVHPTIQRTHIKNRLSNIAEGSKLDWSTAECLAIGSLLFDGYNVRISGQDVGRGTFSHRHAMLVDQETNNIYIPLNNMYDEQKTFLEIANSILSEEAVLGYEYGMSVENPQNLIIWEAQFGDFFNGAQIIFDTFISSGESKWLWSSGLVILLPHGYDGAGPEHSSARVERFLQLTDSKEDRVDGDNINLQVCQPSTPAQYFHLLRRQMIRNFRKPLIIITPKTLLRAGFCRSNFSHMNRGTSFQPVLGDDHISDPLKVKKVLITSGKHYYSLLHKKELLNVKDDTAIIRLEAFTPFPVAELIEQISKYKNANDFIWCQEEPQNMGAWTFVNPRFRNLIGKKLRYCGRPTLATPAVGIGKLHKEQEERILADPFLSNNIYNRK